MPNKPWSQAEENQLVGSLPAGNSIELIATNLSRSTNGVFSRAIGALVALAALPFGLPVDFFSVFAGALGRCFAVGLLGIAAVPCPMDAGLTGAAEAWGTC